MHTYLCLYRGFVLVHGGFCLGIEKFKKCDVTCSWNPTYPCHKLSHLLGPSSVTYFIDGPYGEVRRRLTYGTQNNYSLISVNKKKIYYVFFSFARNLYNYGPMLLCRP